MKLVVKDQPCSKKKKRKRRKKLTVKPLKVLLQQSKSKSSANLQQDANTTSSFNPGTSLGKRKARSPEPTTMDHVSSSSHHNSDSNPDSKHDLTPPPLSTSSSRVRINLSRSPLPTASAISGRKVVQNIPIPSTSQSSSSSTPAHTNPHETHPKAPQDPPHETQQEAPICTAIRQMEHVNATMATLYEALEGEIREAEEADRTRRVRIYRIEDAMKRMNQDARAADNVMCVLNGNAPVSMQDRARLDPELDQYRKMLAKLQDCRVRRDHAAQERRRREQEHQDLLNDELLDRMGNR
jgi:hypothetical protein